jgi:hypothetical protein
MVNLQFKLDHLMVKTSQMGETIQEIREGSDPESLKMTGVE